MLPRFVCLHLVFGLLQTSTGLITHPTGTRRSAVVLGVQSPRRTTPTFFPFTRQRVPLQTADSSSSRSSSSSRNNNNNNNSRHTPAWVENARQRFEPSDMPTAAPTLLGLVLLTAVLYGLVASPEDAADVDSDVASDALRGGSRVVTKVVDELLPNSVSDSVALTLSEGVAGAASSAILFAVSSAVGAVKDLTMRLMAAMQRGHGDGLGSTPTAPDRGSGGSGAFDEAVATADFFYARTAAAGALEGLNVPAAQLLAVVLAQVPYQLAKASANQRGQMSAAKERQPPPPPTPLPPPSPALQLARVAWGTVRQPIAAGAAVGLLNGRRAAAAAGAAVSGGGLQLAAGDTATAAAAAPSAVAFWGIDGVEAVSDLIKWLEYDVLVSDYDDTLSGAFAGVAGPGGDDPLVLSGLASGVFGAVAALSAQVYRDGSLRCGYGQAASRAALARRSPAEWCSTYAKTMSSGALLFGGYETLRKPLAHGALELLSGGGLACWGSGDHDLCVDVYLLDALPSALLQSFTGTN